MNLAAPYSDAVGEGSLPQVRVDQGSGHPNLDILFGYFVFFWMRAAVTQIWIFFLDIFGYFVVFFGCHRESPHIETHLLFKKNQNKVFLGHPVDILILLNISKKEKC